MQAVACWLWLVQRWRATNLPGTLMSAAAARYVCDCKAVHTKSTVLRRPIRPADPNRMLNKHPKDYARSAGALGFDLRRTRWEFVWPAFRCAVRVDGLSVVV